MAPGEAADRHHDVDRREQQDLPGQAQQVQQHAGHAVQGPLDAEQGDAVLAHRLDAAGHQGHHQQAEPHRKDVAVRQDGGDQEMPPTHGEPVQEDHGHGLLQHGEGQGAEEQHRSQQQPTDHIAMFDEVAQLGDHRLGLAGHDPFQVAAEGGEQLALFDQVGQHDHRQDEERHDRQQRVIGDGARQQQALVGLEALEHAPREGPGMRDDVGGRRAEHLHAAEYAVRFAITGAAVTGLP
jgi:hypothetical protein